MNEENTKVSTDVIVDVVNEISNEKILLSADSKQLSKIRKLVELSYGLKTNIFSKILKLSHDEEEVKKDTEKVINILSTLILFQTISGNDVFDELKQRIMEMDVDTVKRTFMAQLPANLKEKEKELKKANRLSLETRNKEFNCEEDILEEMYNTAKNELASVLEKSSSISEKINTLAETEDITKAAVNTAVNLTTKKMLNKSTEKDIVKVVKDIEDKGNVLEIFK